MIKLDLLMVLAIGNCIFWMILAILAWVKGPRYVMDPVDDLVTWVARNLGDLRVRRVDGHKGPWLVRIGG